MYPFPNRPISTGLDQATPSASEPSCRTVPGARDPESHRRLEAQWSELDNGWARLTRSPAQRPDKRALLADLTARHALFTEALRGCEFEGKFWSNRRAEGLLSAARRDIPDTDAGLGRLRCWRDEMSSLLSAALLGGARGPALNSDWPLIPRPSTGQPRNLVHIFRELETHRELIDDARFDPAAAGHSHLLAALELLRTRQATDFEDPDALVRFNEMLRQVRTLEHQAVIESMAEGAGAGSPTIARLRALLGEHP